MTNAKIIDMMKCTYYPPETEWLETSPEECFVFSAGTTEQMIPEDEEDW